MKKHYKIKVIIFLIGIAFCFVTKAQTTISLQPDSETGKDAYLRSLASSNNYGTHPDFSAHAWTNSGIPVTVRGIIDFDLSGIPNGAAIISANLSLYSYDSGSSGSHSTQSGSNEATISRVTSTWDENTVTWNNQPSTTSQNQVFLAASTESIQDYTIDVTNLIEDMINDPSNSHGFLFRQVTEEYYRRMLFASSDNTNSSLHPKLEVTFNEPISSDSCLVIKPDSEIGKDAYLRSLASSINYGTHPDFSAHAWTNSGSPVTVRGIIDFDLSGIPNGAAINSANLSLYSYDSGSSGSHSTQSGSNEATISRVISAWDENTVTWNNQPSTTSQNQVFIAASTESIQDYTIDVTNLIEDMINDPANSHGFLFRQVTEEYYRRMLFASSDNTNSSLHPQLEVCYSLVNSISEETNNNIELNIFPNPASDFIRIEFSNFNREAVSIEIINYAGQIIKHKSDNQSAIEFDVSNFSKGLYFVKLYFNNIITTKKIIIE